MKKVSLENVQPSAPRDRHAEEIAAQNGARKTSNHARLRLGKTKSVLLRMTPERYRLLVSLASTLSAGRPTPVSLTAALEAAIDALHDRLKGGRT